MYLIVQYCGFQKRISLRRWHWHFDLDMQFDSNIFNIFHFAKFKTFSVPIVLERGFLPMRSEIDPRYRLEELHVFFLLFYFLYNEEIMLMIMV